MENILGGFNVDTLPPAKNSCQDQDVMLREMHDSVELLLMKDSTKFFNNSYLAFKNSKLSIATSIVVVQPQHLTQHHITYQRGLSGLLCHSVSGFARD